MGPILNEFLNDDYEFIYKNYREKFPCKKFFFDRTDSIPHYLKIDNCNQIPDPSGFNLSFNDIVEKRAKELLSRGNRINVYWSGGIDSTMILFALYTYANDKSQINVLGNYASIIESGSMFDRLINNRISHNIIAGFKFNHSPNELYITGSNGNDLFFPGIKKGDRDSWMLFKENPQVFKEIIFSPYDKILQESNLEFLDPIIKKCPRPLHTLQDLRWWVSFVFNWQTCKYNIQNTESFYDSDNFNDFQKWAMVNDDNPTLVGDYSDERWQIRNLISEYTGDRNFSKNKEKRTSVLRPFEEDWLFLLNDGTNAYLDDLQSPTSVSYK